MNIAAYIARAFCHNSLGGNPAGVVILNQENPLTYDQMQTIAKEPNFSETVFITPLKSYSYKALYFTPTSSIDFCGHATLAAFGVLKRLGQLNDSTYKLETQAGKCKVILKDHLVFLSQPLPLYGDKIDTAELKHVLGNDVSLMEPSPQIVSTGLREIFVRVRDEENLQCLKPNLEQMSDLNRKTDSIGMHVFSMDQPNSTYTAHCRNFAPLLGLGLGIWRQYEK